MSIDEPPHRGRPRDELVTRSILDAAIDMLSGGSESLSIEAVARRARVSRPSVYKRWPSLADLLMDAILEERHRALPPGAAGPAFPVPDTGSLAGDLKALVQAGFAVFQNMERGGAVQVLFAEAIRSEEVAQRLETMIFQPDEKLLRLIFERARSRGEWPFIPGDETEQDEVLVLRALIAHAVFERYVLHRPLENNVTLRLTELIAARKGRAEA